MSEKYESDLSSKKNQIIELNHELVKNKLRLEEEMLDVKRCR